MAGEGGVPYIGSRINLISKSEIRYEGILYTIDMKESTIALQGGVCPHKLPLLYLNGACIYVWCRLFCNPFSQSLLYMEPCRFSPTALSEHACCFLLRMNCSAS